MLNMLFTILRWAFRAFLLLLALLVLLLIYKSFSRTDSFHIEHAQLADQDGLHYLEARLAQQSALYTASPPVKHQEWFGFMLHHIQPGQGAILAYRKFDPGGVLTHDDESYAKLTVWLPDGLPTKPLKVTLTPQSRIQAVFSNGGSAWPRHDCTVALTQGILQITPTGSHYTVDYLGNIALQPQVNPECERPSIVRQEFTTSALSLSELTPWLGKPGEHPYDETYR